MNELNKNDYITLTLSIDDIKYSKWGGDLTDDQARIILDALKDREDCGLFCDEIEFEIERHKEGMKQ